MDETQVVTVLPDLRAVRLDEMPALEPVTLQKMLQRVLPGTPTETVKLGTAFGSSWAAPRFPDS